VSGLLGLGPGLTPAGDDLICGALAAANHLLPSPLLASELAAAVRQQLARTTAISQQMLSDAINGEYHEYLDNLVADLANNDRPALPAALNELLGLGASSGAALACGLAVVLQAALERSLT